MHAINTRTWSTPLIIGCSLVVASSGVMLFYHLGEDLLKTMHEWLGLLFVGAIILHLLNHWTPFSRYFKNKQAIAIMIVVFAIASAWVVSSSMDDGGKHPAKRLLAKVQQAPLSRVATLQGETGNELVSRLQQAGVKVENNQQSLADLATQNKMHPFELISIVLDDEATM